MLVADELDVLLEKHLVSGQTRSIIHRIRSAPPSARLRTEFGRRRQGYQSRKMRHTIQAADNASIAWLYNWEHQDDIYEVWDQPPAIKLERRTTSGRPTAYTFTPHYFIISADFIGWTEVYSEEKLISLAEKLPDCYVRDPDRQWRSLPGERYAAQFGLGYQVRSSAKISTAFLRNLQYLADYYRDDRPPVEEKVATQVLDLVADEPGILLSDVFERVPEITKDSIFTLIAQERVYVNLQHDPVPEPDRVHCFGDAFTAEAYWLVETKATDEQLPHPRVVKVAPDAQINWDGRVWRIGNIGTTTTTLLSLDNSQVPVELPNAVFESLIRQGKITGIAEEMAEGLSAEAREIFKHATPHDHQVALRHYRIILPDIESRQPTAEEREEYEHIPERTRRDWKAKYVNGKKRYGRGYLTIGASLIRANIPLLPEKAVDFGHCSPLDDHQAAPSGSRGMSDIDSARCPPRWRDDVGKYRQNTP